MLACNILVRYPRCLARLQSSFLTQPEEDWVIDTDRGRLSMPHANGSAGWRFTPVEGEPVEYRDTQTKNGFVYEIQEVIRCVRGGLVESPTAPHSMTMDAAGLYDLMWKDRPRSSDFPGEKNAAPCRGKMPGGARRSLFAVWGYRFSIDFKRRKSTGGAFQKRDGGFPAFQKGRGLFLGQQLRQLPQLLLGVKGDGKGALSPAALDLHRAAQLFGKGQLHLPVEHLL